MGGEIEGTMALRIELEGYKPGIAKFSAKKWNGSAEIDMLIQRNQDGYYLSGLQQWGPEKCWHSIADLSVDNQQISGYVSEWLVDSLLSQDNTKRFLIQLRDKQNQRYIDGGVVSIAEDVLASTALNVVQPPLDNPSVETKSLTEPLELPEEPEQIPNIETQNDDLIEPVKLDVETVIEPEIAQTPQLKKSKSKLGLVITIIIVLLILAGLGLAAWYFLVFQKTQPVEPTAQVNAQCSLNNTTTDDLAFIQQCLQTKPDTQAIIQLINDAKKADKCNIAQRLYANQAQQNGQIAFLYAKEYDEKFYQANNCFKADKGTASYWYETALDRDPNNTLAKERLDELQK